MGTVDRVSERTRARWGEVALLVVAPLALVAVALGRLAGVRGPRLPAGAGGRAGPGGHGGGPGGRPGRPRNWNGGRYDATVSSFSIAKPVVRYLPELAAACDGAGRAQRTVTGTRWTALLA
jgi:hypothetical protein